jgi:hypothetical protein
MELGQSVQFGLYDDRFRGQKRLGSGVGEGNVRSVRGLQETPVGFGTEGEMYAGIRQALNQAELLRYNGDTLFLLHHRQGEPVVHTAVLQGEALARADQNSGHSLREKVFNLIGVPRR